MNPLPAVQASECLRLTAPKCQPEADPSGESGLILLSQALQLGRRVFLSIVGRVLDLPLSTAVDPVTQGGSADPEILGDLSFGPATRLNETNGLILKLLRKASVRFGHGSRHAS
jgi:hypothetical protein